MRFYSWKSCCTSSLTVTGIVSGIYLLKATGCNCGTVWQSVWSFENDPSSCFHSWMAKPLFSMTIWKFAPETATRCNVISTRASSRLVLLTFAGWLPDLQRNQRPQYLIGQAECAKWGKSTQIGYFPDTWKYNKAPQTKNQAFTAALGVMKPIGFDNQVLEDEQFTSLFWNVLARRMVP